ncbi:MAG: hypothetical protein LBD84_01355 [Campylobacteraceae bacterium]|jgi:hypothetical protein|nr:hypothetical protein [Campylobacteraceae bacterium]
MVSLASIILVLFHFWIVKETGQIVFAYKINVALDWDFTNFTIIVKNTFILITSAMLPPFIFTQ